VKLFKTAIRFFMFVGIWLFLSWFPIQLSDFDFKEAIHSSEVEATVRLYWLKSAIEAVVFSLVLLTSPQGRAKVAGLLWCCACCYLIVFGAYWFLVPDTANSGYKTFLVNTYASKAIRISMVVYLGGLVAWFLRECLFLVVALKKRATS
jgi:hypothetical protein